MKGIIGRKVGMTQVYTVEGTLYPVTVVEVLPNVILQIKTKEIDGYNTVQLGYEDKKEKNVPKALMGHFKKANTSPKMFIREVDNSSTPDLAVGNALNVDIFQNGDIVDVTGVTKGKGFSGGIKRWGFSRGPMAHGSGYHRGVGSMATVGRTNNRIHPGKKMSGHHGNYTRTIQNLEVLKVDLEKSAILIKGAIPGANKSLVIIKSAVKAQKNKKQVKNLLNYNTIAE